MQSIIRIVLCGYTSVGKSVFFNSLCKRYIQRSGDANITTDKRTFEEILKSDDGYSYTITDLPCISDDAKRNKEIYEEIIKHDVIIWCSSYNSAFSNKQEKDDVDKIYNILQKDSITKRRSHELVICLTKCNINTNDQQHDTKQNATLDGELTVPEISKNVQVYRNVHNLYKDKCRIMCMNAYGRILSNKKKCSEALKQLVYEMNYHCTEFNNIDFNLDWYFANEHTRMCKIHLHNFAINYEHFINKVYSIKHIYDPNNCHRYEHSLNLDAVQENLNEIKKTINTANDDVNTIIIFAFLCYRNNLRKYILEQCNYDMNIPFIYEQIERDKPNQNADLIFYEKERETIVLLNELKNDIRKVANNIYKHNRERFDNHNIIKYEDHHRNYKATCSVVKYWLMFGHSIAYYRKFYEYYDWSRGSYHMSVQYGPYVCQNMKRLEFRLNYDNFPFKTGNTKPNPDETAIPLIAWYDIQISNNNDCIKCKTFIDECKYIYTELHGSNDVNMVLAIATASKGKQNYCNGEMITGNSSRLPISIFQKCTYKSKHFGVIDFFESLVIDNIK